MNADRRLPGRSGPHTWFKQLFLHRVHIYGWLTCVNRGSGNTNAVVPRCESPDTLKQDWVRLKDHSTKDRRQSGNDFSPIGVAQVIASAVSVALVAMRAIREPGRNWPRPRKPVGYEIEADDDPFPEAPKIELPHPTRGSFLAHLADRVTKIERHIALKDETDDDKSS